LEYSKYPEGHERGPKTITWLVNLSPPTILTRSLCVLADMFSDVCRCA